VLDYLNLHPDPAILNFCVAGWHQFLCIEIDELYTGYLLGKATSTSSLLEYAIYIAFFPALIAGPIDRAGRLLPQIHQNRFVTPNHFSAGIFFDPMGIL
jgi:D-alanyl-lipoteichoic acid acyltransferase DltB (MBOAT superfamily)